MIKLKDILLEHPQSKIDTKFTKLGFSNRCDDPHNASKIETALDTAKAYWLTRLDNPNWAAKYAYAQTKSTVITSTIANTIKQYKQAIEKSKLLVISEKEYIKYSDIYIMPIPDAIAFILDKPNDFNIYARCVLAKKAKKTIESVMVHELTHILFRISPFNSTKEWEKALNLIDSGANIRRVNFDDRKDQILQRISNDRYASKIDKQTMDELIKEFLVKFSTTAGKVYYCKHTEKQSNLASLNYLLGKAPSAPITPNDMIQVLEYRHPKLSSWDGQVTKDEGLSQAYNEASMLFYCWLASLGMNYDTESELSPAWPYIRSPWISFSEYCRELSNLVAQQGNTNSTNDKT